jgi:hypothetical protein
MGVVITGTVLGSFLCVILIIKKGVECKDRSRIYFSYKDPLTQVPLKLNPLHKMLHKYMLVRLLAKKITCQIIYECSFTYAETRYL